MDKLQFVKPSISLKEQALEYKEEHIQFGEEELHGGALLGCMLFDDWLQLTTENASIETVHANWVVSSTYFVVRESDHKIIGMVDIRHELNEFLASYGGHIGYGVRPSERRKGYGAQILQKALVYAYIYGLKEVMVACNKVNTASQKIILSCHGKKEREFLASDGMIVESYWIQVPQPSIQIQEVSIYEKDAMQLLEELNLSLASITGASGEASFHMTDIQQIGSAFMIGYINEDAMGCGAIRKINDDTAEVKRMYARPNHCGFGSAMLSKLEQKVIEFGYKKAVVETRKVNQRAVKFYLQNGYTICDNYGKYQEREEAICFMKYLQ